MAAALVAAALRSGSRRRPWPLLLVAALVGVLLTVTPTGRELGRGTDDLQLRLLAPDRQSEDVVVFDIDDATLTTLRPVFGNWPFQRDVYALAIDTLRAAGARAIAIDLLFADSGPADAALARAVNRPGAPVVLAAVGLEHGSDHTIALQVMAGSAVHSAATHQPAHLWPALALPAASVWQGVAAPRFGVITTPLDRDGLLRALPAWHRDAHARLPALPVAVQHALEPAGITPLLLDAKGGFTLVMPAPENWPLVLPFSELAQVAMGQRDAAQLRKAVDGRVVYLGSSALMADTVMTTQGQASGTSVLAQMTAAIMSQQGVRPHDWRLDLALLALALVPAAVAVARGRVNPVRETTSTAVVGLVLAGLSLGTLLGWRQPTAWLPPLATLAVALAMALWHFQRGQTAARRRLARELDVMEATSKAKAAFLANVSHEIRTPLNALLGVSELLASTPLNPEQRQHVQVFRDAGHTLYALINDLLNLSRIEAGRLEIHPGPFDLHATLGQLIRLMQVRANDKGISLSLELAPDLPRRVVGDALRMEQALLNLLGNAIKFTPRGEIWLRAWTDPEDARLLRFDVQDSGIGIAASKLQAIFEPFTQADISVTRNYGGTGLGLSITRSLATLMGGTVQVDSAPGLGSTFTLRLPLPADPATEPPAPDTNVSTSAGLGEQAFRLPDWAQASEPMPVLLAEDNEVNVYIFRAMLQDLPLELHHAANGPAALDLLERKDFSLAFLDVQMPGMDGLSVTRELRKLEARDQRPRTPVVALTGNAFPSDVQDALDAGCDRHLAKPFTREMLIQSLSQLARRPSALPPRAEDQEVGERTRLRAALDVDAAARRAGGDAALHARLREHALVFMTDWAAHFEMALHNGQIERAYRLARDLHSIAFNVGADALATQAAALENALSTAQDGSQLDPAARARTLAALPPVIAALSDAAGPPTVG